MRLWMGVTLLGCVVLTQPELLSAENPTMGNRVVYDSNGVLQPWIYE